MMEASSRNIIDVFIKLIQSLECPVCYEYVSSPIWQCESGHIICNECKSSIYNCPTCRNSISNVRVRSLEQISDLMLFPCKNNGCDKILSLTDIKNHENNCTIESSSNQSNDLSRSSSLQYNILKYIEHDIAPFFINGRQSTERETQTDLKGLRTNFKDASTMANPLICSTFGTVGLSDEGFAMIEGGKLTTVKLSVGGTEKNSSLSKLRYALKAPPAKDLKTAAKNTTDLPEKKSLKFAIQVPKKSEQSPNTKGSSLQSMSIPGTSGSSEPSQASCSSHTVDHNKPFEFQRAQSDKGPPLLTGSTSYGNNFKYSFPLPQEVKNSFSFPSNIGLFPSGSKDPDPFLSKGIPNTLVTKESPVSVQPDAFRSFSFASGNKPPENFIPFLSPNTKSPLPNELFTFGRGNNTRDSASQANSNSNGILYGFYQNKFQKNQ